MESFLISVSADVRAKAAVKGGDEITVELSLDTAPREVAVPAEFGAALAGSEAARKSFEAMPFSHKSRHVLVIEDAKTPETRRRRIEKAIEMLTG